MRHAKGYTQASLAAAAQLHRNYVSAVERGEYNLTAVNILRLAKALGITVSELTNVGEGVGSEGEDKASN